MDFCAPETAHWCHGDPGHVAIDPEVPCAHRCRTFLPGWSCLVVAVPGAQVRGFVALSLLLLHLSFQGYSSGSTLPASSGM